MNSLKTLLVVGILAVVGYGAYLWLNKNSQEAPPPPEIPEGWSSNPPSVSLGAATEAPPFSAASGDGAGAVGQPPPMSLSPTPSPGSPSRGSAPPFPTAPPPVPIPGGDALTPPGPAVSGPIPPGIQQPAAPLTVGPPVPPEARGGLAPPSSPVDAASGGGPGDIDHVFSTMMEAAQNKLRQEGSVAMDEVLLKLTSWYGSPQLSPEESQQMIGLLDQIAGNVIYSNEHHIEPPHEVKPGETIEQIAEQYKIPWQLLAKINGIRDPNYLAPGHELKVVRGPFEAVIHLDDYELTLKVQGRYAGRFPIGIGRDQYHLEGTYRVRDKMINPTYYGRDRIVDADDPANPLGERWIGLGLQVGIHGTNDPANIGRNDGQGTICLGDRDVEDVFDILSVGSRVVIQR